MAQAFTRRLAQYILERNSDDSPPEPAAARSKNIMINAAAVALAGSAQPEALAVARFVRDMGGDGKCTVIGMGLRTSPVHACLANGLMVRLLEFDDDIVGYGGHPTAVVFPVVMALAELERCSGSKVLNAFIHGCEIVSKLGALAAPGDPDQPGATNPDRLSGPLGAAAAAGMIMGLDLSEIATALELASAGNIHFATRHDWKGQRDRPHAAATLRPNGRGRNYRRPADQGRHDNPLHRIQLERSGGMAAPRPLCRSARGVFRDTGESF